MAHDSYEIAADFYRRLRSEVVEGNPNLTRKENETLRAYYPIMMQDASYPMRLAQRIYASRRRHAVAAICAAESPVVLDAGCGYGSESFLFAALGAQVIAVDVSAAQIAIAEKRQPYFESFNKPLAIDFLVADLNTYVPPTTDLSLTWLASVLPAIKDKLDFLQRIRGATRPGGRVLITDLNTANPMFGLAELRRGHFGEARLSWVRPLLDRLGRRQYDGRRYPIGRDNPDGYSRFFSSESLARLLTASGLTVSIVDHAGFAPPRIFGRASADAEAWLGRLPWITRFGLFYTVGADK
jgi:SAM-dependent methyltransferase